MVFLGTATGDFPPSNPLSAVKERFPARAEPQQPSVNAGRIKTFRGSQQHWQSNGQLRFRQVTELIILFRQQRRCFQRWSMDCSYVLLRVLLLCLYCGEQLVKWRFYSGKRLKIELKFLVPLVQRQTGRETQLEQLRNMFWVTFYFPRWSFHRVGELTANLFSHAGRQKPKDKLAAGTPNASFQFGTAPARDLKEHPKLTLIISTGAFHQGVKGGPQI